MSDVSCHITGDKKQIEKDMDFFYGYEKIHPLKFYIYVQNASKIDKG